MKHRVLLVDDDPNILAGLSRALHREPFEIVTMTSPIEAVDFLFEEAVDAIVSDHDMPGMNGVEFLSEVLQIQPSTVRIMLTGNATLDVAIKAVNGGQIHRFFTKPCSRSELSASLRQLLQQKDLFEEARKLLLKTKQQEALIRRMQNSDAALEQVDRDESGAIVLEDIPDDIERLLAELSDER